MQRPRYFLIPGKKLYLGNDIKEHFKWPPKEYVQINFSSAMPQIVYVTGANYKFYR